MPSITVSRSLKDFLFNAYDIADTIKIYDQIQSKTTPNNISLTGHFRSTVNKRDALSRPYVYFSAANAIAMANDGYIFEFWGHGWQSPSRIRKAGIVQILEGMGGCPAFNDVMCQVHKWKDIKVAWDGANNAPIISGVL